MKKLLIFILLASITTGFAQGKKIRIIYGGYVNKDELKYPGATVLTRDNDRLVTIEHEGAILTCKRAIYYKEKNFFKAFGDVLIKQGDSITQTSDYVDYNGDTRMVLSWGNVVLKDKKMTLTTDTLNFDRAKQKLYYTQHAKIKDETNTLTSKVGTYSLEQNKFTATTKVFVTNPEHVLESNHLDYYTDNGYAYLYGSSTIKSKDNTIYTERGFYDSKAEISRFVKNSKIYFTNRTIEGDSLYYDKYKGFASATTNIKLVDSLQNFVAKGNYAEYFELKDSAFIIDKAVAITVIEKDSMYVHGDTLLVTGKPENRIVRIYHDVRIFKSDLQGVCDSIHSNQQTGLTRLFKNPVLWSKKNQITGDDIHLISNPKTNKLDSIKILSNAFIAELDTIVENTSSYNQIKGRDMYGTFIDGKLKYFLVDGNAEVIYFNRNDGGFIETITKQEASNIEFEMGEENSIDRIKYLKKTEGKSYPPDKLPIQGRLLKGFIWRDSERPNSVEDLFKKVTPKNKLKIETSSN